MSLSRMPKAMWRTSVASACLALAVSLPAWAFQEAPDLAAKVAAGELPPLEERMPDEPMVMETLDSIGEYGGTLRRAILGGGDQHNILRQIGTELMVRWSHDWSEVKPNIAKSWTVSDDATTYTFELRPGMRWSDGEPFSADDIMFWYEVFLERRP